METLAQLLKYLLGSEPAIRLRVKQASNNDWQELVEAMREGFERRLFVYRFSIHDGVVLIANGNLTDLPAPTVEYDLDKYQRKLLT